MTGKKDCSMIQPRPGLPDQNWFKTTHWSVVLSARGEGEPARESLERLCSEYWYPLYAYVRRQGFDQFEAEDLTQGFFEHLLQRDRLGRADRNKGRFRTFLLAALQNFLNDHRDHSRRVKRGGRHTIVSWDAQEAEARYLLEPADEVTPEILFDRHWAAITLNRVRERIRSEFQAGGKEMMYDLLSAHADGREMSYEEIAGRLDTTEAAVKSTAHRLRQRLREVLWEEVAHTVSSPQELQLELRALVGLAAAESF
jgi:RNA polymerase sigma-70 factor (ECF subfamily)